jgi:carnosine synthase
MGNFMSAGATAGERDIDVSDARLETPQSQSSPLEEMLGDKVLTRVVLARANISVPLSIALLYRAKRGYPSMEGTPVRALSLTDVAILATSVKVKKFVKSFVTELQHQLGDLARCVVKPSGPRWMGSAGVTFHTSNDLPGILEAIISLGKRLYEGDAILVEEFAPTFDPHDVLRGRDLALAAVLNPLSVTESERVGDALVLLQKQAKLDRARRRRRHKNGGGGAAAAGGARHERAPSSASSDSSSGDDVAVATVTDGNDDFVVPATRMKVRYAFRLRALVQRSVMLNGAPIVAKMVCGVGPADEPLHGVNTSPQSLEVTLCQWGLTPERVADVIDAVRSESRVAFEALTAYDNLHLTTPAQRGGARAAVDALGLDFILTSRGTGTVVPVCIEVNDHDSTYQSQLTEYILPETRGECVRAWLRSALERSAHYLLVGKRILMVGGGGYSKLPTFQIAQRAKLEVTLVDAHEDHYAKDMVARFLHYPALDDHSRDAENAADIMEKFGLRPEDFDGVVTFWEDCIIVASMLREALGKRGDSVKATTIAKSKVRTHRHLAGFTEDIDWRPRAALFASAPVPIDVAPGVDLAALQARLAKDVTFPAVIKTEYGSSALGVKMVSNAKDAVREALKLRDSLRSEADHPGSGLSFDPNGASLFLQVFLDGSEHDVDMVLFDGELVGSLVSDNAPTRLPYFAETACAAPSQLHEHWVKSLVSAAVICTRSLGFTDGTYNVELKMQSCGPKLIEINARAGGFYLHKFISMLRGWDNFHASFSVAAGVRPYLDDESECGQCIVGAMLYASKHGDVLRAGLLDRLSRGLVSDRVVWCQFETDVPEVTEYEEPVGNLAVKGKTFEDARSTLLSIIDVLGIDEASEGLPLSWFLHRL